jgi:hypothetical protein
MLIVGLMVDVVAVRLCGMSRLKAERWCKVAVQRSQPRYNIFVNHSAEFTVAINEGCGRVAPTPPLHSYEVEINNGSFCHDQAQLRSVKLVTLRCSPAHNLARPYGAERVASGHHRGNQADRTP